MTRWQAAGVHLAISAAVAALALAATLGVMYPLTYFRAGGANELLTILLSVDVVIGPLLTLIVFKTGKPSLRFDLACIAVLQAAAMAYGFFVMIQARPVFLVHVVDRFHLVRANELEPELLAAGPEARFRSLSWTGPRLAVAQKPTDVNRQQELLMSAISGADLNRYPETYTDYQDNSAVVLARAQPLSLLLEGDPEGARLVSRYLKRRGLQAQDLKFLPLQVGSAFLTALVDARSAKLMTVLTVDPWP